jgi:hypothetical protein
LQFAVSGNALRVGFAGTGQAKRFSDGCGRAAERRRVSSASAFKDFLARRFRVERGRGAIAAERVRIAEFFLDRRYWEKALPYLLDAEDYERAAQTIADRAAHGFQAAR